MVNDVLKIINRQINYMDNIVFHGKKHYEYREK